MNRFLVGFTDELVKVGGIGGALKSVGKFSVKHPMVAMLGASTLIGTAVAAKNAYREGLRGGEKGRYLAASLDGGPSEAAYTNYHPMFKNRKPAHGALKRLHRNYDEAKFKR